ncbi:hypothetical protein C4J81_06150 [Deltaproteobacteria bacterium Smac51]|nr:hypothetical protein C4J81_06150 [Deltaproteobacteria bacterium Smac51]
MDTIEPDVLLNIRELTSILVFAIVVLPVMAISGFMGSISGWSIATQAFQNPVVLLVGLVGIFGGAS